MRLGFFLRESWRALRRNAAPSLAAAATVLITTLVLGVFIPVVRAATSKTNEVRNKIEIEVFIEPDASKAEIEELGNQIREIDHVKSIQFVSKDQAKQLLQKRVGEDILENVPPNFALPPSYRIKLDNPANIDQVKAALQPVGADGKPHLVNPIIQRNNGIKDREDETAKILSATRTIKIVLATLAGLLILASILLVANTIRLSIFARRREVEVMRLVGATNWFVRWPFVIEGLLVGFLGGVGAVFLLWFAKVTIVDPLSDSLALVAAPETINFRVLAVVLLVAAMVVSAIGSGITLRRFLRI
ncbi:MAG: permease-like cell division protein FtsX [Solirubrobacterales bacterium]